MAIGVGEDDEGCRCLVEVVVEGQLGIVGVCGV